VRLVLAPNDRFIDAALVRRSLAYCSHATAVEIPNVGHWLLHEEPERTSREMIEFFDAERARVDPGGAGSSSVRAPMPGRRGS
jgi:pimeloyl-ACP methyl ester carboxylesterase